MFPRPTAFDLGASPSPGLTRALAVRVNVNECGSQCLQVRLEQPQIRSCSQPADGAITKHLLCGGNLEARAFIHKVIRGAAVSDNDRKRTRHGFEYGKCESFSTIGMDQTVTRIVE